MSAGKEPVVELICVGSELLEGQVNTHESYIGLKLRAAALRIARAATLPDDRAGLASAIAESLSRCDALLICGGLGPTFDDLTREALGDAVGRPLVFSKPLWRGIERKFARHRMPVPEENKRQAFLIRGARALANATGSAPGQILELPRPGAAPQLIALMPGPFSELAPMFEGAVLPRLKASFARGRFTEHAVLRLTGLPESSADERLAGLTAKPDPGAQFTILAGKGMVSFHMTVTDSSRAKAERRLNAYRRRALAAVGDHVFGQDDDSLESALGAALLDRGWTLAVAESCTGGGAGHRLTGVPGSSKWFRGGVIAYDNALKTGLLRVSERTLKERGAVSLECAREMARGARAACGATLGLSITGVAGPGGGTKAKPVGLVCLGIAGPGEDEAAAVQGRFGDARAMIRERAIAAAIGLALKRCRRSARGSA